MKKEITDIDILSWVVEHTDEVLLYYLKNRSSNSEVTEVEIFGDTYEDIGNKEDTQCLKGTTWKKAEQERKEIRMSYFEHRLKKGDVLYMLYDVPLDRRGEIRISYDKGPSYFRCTVGETESDKKYNDRIKEEVLESSRGSGCIVMSPEIDTILPKRITENIFGEMLKYEKEAGIKIEEYKEGFSGTDPIFSSPWKWKHIKENEYDFYEIKMKNGDRLGYIAVPKVKDK